jgi:hypothetical protein
MRGHGLLRVVDGGGGGVGAAGGRGPAQHAGFGLLSLPAGGLLAAVVAAAAGVGVALVGGAVGVGNDVVDVAVDGLGAAAGGGEGAGAGADEVPELAAGAVMVLAVPVVAGAPGDGLEGEVQLAQPFRDLLGLATGDPVVCAGPGAGRPGIGRPGIGTCAAWQRGAGW